jgi:hypothetical protein
VVELGRGLEAAIEARMPRDRTVLMEDDDLARADLGQRSPTSETGTE